MEHRKWKKHCQWQPGDMEKDLEACHEREMSVFSVIIVGSSTGLGCTVCRARYRVGMSGASGGNRDPHIHRAFLITKIL